MINTLSFNYLSANKESQRSTAPTENRYQSFGITDFSKLLESMFQSYSAPTPSIASHPARQDSFQYSFGSPIVGFGNAAALPTPVKPNTTRLGQTDILTNTPPPAVAAPASPPVSDTPAPAAPVVPEPASPVGETPTPVAPPVAEPAPAVATPPVVNTTPTQSTSSIKSRPVDYSFEVPTRAELTALKDTYKLAEKRADVIDDLHSELRSYNTHKKWYEEGKIDKRRFDGNQARLNEDITRYKSVMGEEPTLDVNHLEELERNEKSTSKRIAYSDAKNSYLADQMENGKHKLDIEKRFGDVSIRKSELEFHLGLKQRDRFTGLSNNSRDFQMYFPGEKYTKENMQKLLNEYTAEYAKLEPEYNQYRDEIRTKRRQIEDGSL